MSLLINFQLGNHYDRFLERAKPPRPRLLYAFKPLLILFAWVSFIIIILTGFGLFFFFINATINAEETGVIQTIYTKVDVALSKIPIVDVLYNAGKEIIKIQEDPSRPFRRSGWQTEIDDSEDNMNLGLSFIERFSPNQGTYLLNEKVKLISTAQLHAIEDTKVTFGCNITNGYPNDKEIKITKPEIQPVTILKDTTKTLDLSCEISGEPPFVLSGDEQIKEKKVRLDATYGFTVKSYIPVYTMQKAYLDSIENKRLNPFEYPKKIDDPLLDKSTRKARSKTSNGPMVISILVGAAQPLTEDVDYSSDDTYNLAVKIKKSSSEWFGRLNKLNNVYIYLPNNFQLVDDKGIFEGESLDNDDFENEEPNFKKYKLQQDEIDRLNNQCKILFGGYNNQECISLFEEGFVLIDSKFKIINLQTNLLEPNFIRVKTSYDFQAYTTTSFTIVKAR